MISNPMTDKKTGLDRTSHLQSQIVAELTSELLKTPTVCLVTFIFQPLTYLEPFS